MGCYSVFWITLAHKQPVWMIVCFSFCVANIITVVWIYLISGNSTTLLVMYICIQKWNGWLYEDASFIFNKLEVETYFTDIKESVINESGTSKSQAWRDQQHQAVTINEMCCGCLSCIANCPHWTVPRYACIVDVHVYTIMSYTSMP